MVRAASASSRPLRQGRRERLHTIGRHPGGEGPPTPHTLNTELPEQGSHTHRRNRHVSSCVSFVVVAAAVIYFLQIKDLVSFLRCDAPSVKPGYVGQTQAKQAGDVAYLGFNSKMQKMGPFLENPVDPNVHDPHAVL